MQQLQTAGTYTPILEIDKKLYDNLCNGPIFQDKWLWIGPFTLSKSHIPTFSWIKKISILDFSQTFPNWRHVLDT